MTHLPTGLKVVINGRDFHSNKREARRILAASVAERKKAEADAEYTAYRMAQMGGGGRSDNVRTYNFIHGRVVDHRLKVKIGDISAIMKGEFQRLFKKASKANPGSTKKSSRH
jgi:peptide chain release factor 1